VDSLKFANFRAAALILPSLFSIQTAQQVKVGRWPPFGGKAKSAHNMAREYEIMTALKAGFASVPETYFYSGDETLIGSEFFVMRWVPGTLIGRELPAEWNL
jgi:aminoglycoside phosphotransferase (APT) family kinase protein